MKKILTGVIGCVFLFVIFSFLFPMSTVKSTVNLYWILNHRPFVTYVDCERVLNRAASKDTVYADVSRYMDEGTYNNLSVKTKSFYHDGQPWDDTVHVIQQQKEKDADAETNRRRKERHLSERLRLFDRRDQKTPDRCRHHHAGRKTRQPALYRAVHLAAHKEHTRSPQRRPEEGDKQSPEYIRHKISPYSVSR